MNHSITLTSADIQLLLDVGFCYMFLAVFAALIVYDFGLALPGLFVRIYRLFREPVDKPVEGKSHD